MIYKYVYSVKKINYSVMKNMIIASTSTIHGSGYLEYLLPTLKVHFKNCSEIIFIPFARPGGITHTAYTEIARKAFATIGINVKGIHEFDDYTHALQNADGIFTGGGNTFLLVSQLYKHNVMLPLKEIILKGTPYLGTSAGSNICGLTMHTTNDMPIIYPPSFKTLGVLSFNINPHYLDVNPKSTHKGETRETRIKEFHVFNGIPVVGLREGSWLSVKGDEIYLKGDLEARIFEKDTAPYEVIPATSLSELN